MQFVVGNEKDCKVESGDLMNQLTSESLIKKSFSTTNFIIANNVLYWFNVASRIWLQLDIVVAKTNLNEINVNFN